MIKRVGVLGAGQMGSGIAQVLAQYGIDAILVDIEASRLEKALTHMKASLEKLMSKGVIAESIEVVMNRIKTGTQMEDLSHCDLVIEAINEDRDLKFKIFKKLDAICKPQAILASNTSSISITEIASQTNRPTRVIGMHFMNPVPLMKLVEIINGLQTDESVTLDIQKLTEKLQKTWVVSKDFPGFIVNRVLMPMINEAIYAVYEGVASPENIDTAMKLGTHQPMGPLALADFIGLDTCLAILNVLFQGLGDPKYRPCPLLKQFVLAGYLGKKSGRGFYIYN